MIVTAMAKAVATGRRSSAAKNGMATKPASMSNKPELEIFADDVVCGHGATVGQLDEDQLFYLMARGLPKADAESLLIEAFAVDVFDFVSDTDMREVLGAKVHSWLSTRDGAVK